MGSRATKKKGIHEDRSIARRKAVQLVYAAQITGQPLPELLAADNIIEEIGVLPEFACQLLQGLSEHLEEVDERVAEASANWSLERMPLTDRCILRLATFEMLYEDRVPVSVSINEAIELARAFGGEDGSGSFINGVLGNIARQEESRVAS